MLAVPKQAQKEFEQEFISEEHHGEGYRTQKTFKRQALSLVSEMGNPFLDDTPELLMLDTQNVIDKSVVNTVRTVEAMGRDQYNTYHKSVIIDRTCSRSRGKPIPKTQAGQISADVELFSRLYIVMQHREGNMSTFFRHENHPFYLTGGNYDREKSRICCSKIHRKSPPFHLMLKYLTGTLSPTNSIITFDEYASQVFIPHIIKHLDTSSRVDVVWDT